MVSPQMFLIIFMKFNKCIPSVGTNKAVNTRRARDSTNVLVHSIYRQAFLMVDLKWPVLKHLYYLIMMIVTLLQFKFEKKGYITNNE